MRMVKPSGRSSGSSSSSHSIGADTGAPGAGARAVRRDERLVDRVLGVVEPGQARRGRSLLPLPADEFGHDGADGPGQLLRPRSGCPRTSARLDRDPDLDAAPAGHLRARRAPSCVPTRRGAAGPASSTSSQSSSRRDRCRSARTSAARGWSTRDVHGVELERAVVRRPHQRGRLVDDEVRTASRRDRRPGSPSA